MEVICTKDSEWLDKWDDYVINEKKAGHLLLSDWNKSFEEYGFDFEITLLVEESKIYGGYAAVIARVGFFKFYIVPYGPIISEEKITYFNELISEVPKRAKVNNCCYCHITIPNSKTLSVHCYNHLPEFPILRTSKKGHLFKYVYSSNGLNWKSFENISNENELLESLKSNLRRDVRSSCRKGLVAKELVEENDIRKGYELCLENAKENNYSIREWSAFKNTLIHLVKNDKAKFIAAFKDDDLKGAIFIVKSGNYYTYSLGGTKKEKPDLLVGHFLQFAAMKAGIAESHSGYNISLGGSKGVVNLKNSYADCQLIFEDSKYHWVLNPLYFKFYLLIENKLRKHKKRIAKFLKYFKNE